MCNNSFVFGVSATLTVLACQGQKKSPPPPSRKGLHVLVGVIDIPPGDRPGARNTYMASIYPVLL